MGKLLKENGMKAKELNEKLNSLFFTLLHLNQLFLLIFLVLHLLMKLN